MSEQDNKTINFDKNKSYSHKEMKRIFDSDDQSRMGKVDSLFVNKNKYKNKENANIEKKENKRKRNTVVKIEDIVIEQ